MKKHWVLVRLIHFKMQSSLFFLFSLFLRYITVRKKFKAKSSADSFTFHQRLLKTSPKHRLSDLSSIFHAGICISKKHTRDVCAYRSKCDCTQPAGTPAESYGEFLHKVLSTFHTEKRREWCGGGGNNGLQLRLSANLELSCMRKDALKAACFMFIAISCLITGLN